MNIDVQFNHKSVMTQEILCAMDPKHDMTYVDATFGGGGHAYNLLHKYQGSKIIAFDMDASCIETANKFHTLFPGRFQFYNDNFANIAQYIDQPVDGIYADLGMSNMQLNSDRGFSFMKPNNILDMRMSDNAIHTAEYILNTYDYNSLRKIFIYNANDYKYAKNLSRNIIKYRENKAISTVQDMLNIIDSICPKISYRAKVFQAIRMHVNSERENIKHFLRFGVNLLNRNAAIGVISFHSIEDKLIKDFFFTHSSTSCNRYEKQVLNEPVLYLKKPYRILPTESEIHANNMARSAILRIAYKNI